MDVVDSIAPKKNIRIRNNHLPWVDSEMKKLFLQRDKMHELAKNYHSDHPTRKTFKELRNNCASTLKKKMKEFYISKTSSDFNSSKDYWSFYKSVIKTKKSSNSKQAISNIIYGLNNMSNNCIEVSNILELLINLC